MRAECRTAETQDPEEVNRTRKSAAGNSRQVAPGLQVPGGGEVRNQNRLTQRMQRNSENRRQAGEEMNRGGADAQWQACARTGRRAGVQQQARTARSHPRSRRSKSTVKRYIATHHPAFLWSNPGSEAGEVSSPRIRSSR